VVMVGVCVIMRRDVGAGFVLLSLNNNRIDLEILDETQEYARQYPCENCRQDDLANYGHGILPKRFCYCCLLSLFALTLNLKKASVR